MSRAGRAVERRRRTDPALGATDARHADLPLRRAGLDRAAVDHRHQPGRLAAGPGPHPSDPLARASCSSSCRTSFMTETAELADVVLPAATWGEKTGDVHQRRPHGAPVRAAVDPPGEARADLDIFLDYARRMDFRDRDGAPLIRWTDAAGAFEAWKACSKGRPCDYSALSYERLRDAGAASSGAASGCTPTASSTPTRRSRDVRPGPRHRRAGDRARVPRQAPDGRAFLHAVEYRPVAGGADRRVPAAADAGARCGQFHTRTKTAHAPELDVVAPEVWSTTAIGTATRGPPGPRTS